MKLRDIKAYVKREKDAIPRAHAVIEAARLQRAHLDHLAANLPAFLPSLASPAGPAPAVILQERGNAPSIPAGQASKPAVGGVKPKAVTAPSAARRYITQEEFNSVSTYMRGRLTADKVNAALDELAAHAEANAALVSAARRNRPVGADKKHALWLLHNFAPVEGLKGRMWVMEADLKSGAALRLDKTGKTVLTLLRHLGRVAEVRVPVDGTVHLAYAVLQG